MNWILGAVALYYLVAVVAYWRLLIAVWSSPKPAAPPRLSPAIEPPILIAIAPCRGGAEAIAGMVKALKQQNYPAQRHRTIILIDRVDADDRSAEIALAAGAEVYERRDAEIRTKGGAVNELLATQLEGQPWHAVIILDIDVRPDPDFFNRVAAHLNQGAQVIQGAPRSKEEGQAISRLNHVGQLLSQMFQQGRAALGRSAILSGACMVMSRSALSRLDWQTSTGRRLSDDGELNFRCLLNNLPVTYAPDLEVLNDLPQNIRAVHLQRRRWFSAYVEGLIYVMPLLKKGLRGQPRLLEGLYTLMFMPGSSLSFVLAGLGTGVLGVLFSVGSISGTWVFMFASLWVLHAAYYWGALRTVGGILTWQEFKHLPAFLSARLVAIGSGILLGSRRNPGHHSVPFKATSDAAENRARDHLKKG